MSFYDQRKYDVKYTWCKFIHLNNKEERKREREREGSVELDLYSLHTPLSTVFTRSSGRDAHTLLCHVFISGKDRFGESGNHQREPGIELTLFSLFPHGWV